ncbi:hypothetical protein L6164_003748 [Bauhinia variegata]|uniref:Uncharacterized protein n=1 Tax=Bauhinia variegata TaxID=167791 RepID=A0ACB9Q1S1_BAUVA|nr:hypothetical protein L6164_003748 [Bauhinia variegata]
MLNPFSKDRISPPPMSTLPNVIAYHDEEYTITDRLYRIGADYRLVVSKSLLQEGHIKKVIISSSPGIMGMIIYGCCRKLAYCKLGDKEWTGIGTDPKPDYRDAVFDGRKIYAVSALEFFEIDIESGEVIKLQLRRAVMENFHPRRNYLYVVCTPDGTIMVIISNLIPHICFARERCRNCLILWSKAAKRVKLWILERLLLQQCLIL